MQRIFIIKGRCSGWNLHQCEKHAQDDTEKIERKSTEERGFVSTEASKFHRAQKTYGASIAENLKNNQNLDEKAMRISTAEACGLLLRELGCQEEVQKTILEAVVLNNVDRKSS